MLIDSIGPFQIQRMSIRFWANGKWKEFHYARKLLFPCSFLFAFEEVGRGGTPPPLLRLPRNQQQSEISVS